MIPEYERKEAEMFERALSWLERLGGIQAIMGERIRLSWRDEYLPEPLLVRKLVQTLYQYAISNPNRDITTQGLYKFAGLDDSRRLTTLIKAAFRDRISSSPRILGSIINALRKEAGADNSYIEEVVEKYPSLRVGYRDIVGDIRIPPRIDCEIARSAGWISAASYIEDRCDYVTSEGVERKRLRKQRYQLSFRRENIPFIELEIIPFFEEYFNYTPRLNVFVHEMHGRKLQCTLCEISRRSIVSFYRDIIGIPDEKGERMILFDGELRRYFIAGLIDIWGTIFVIEGRPSIQLVIPLEFKKIAGELAAELNYSPTISPHNIVIRFASVRKIPEAFEKYPISNPRLLFTMLWWKRTRELKKYL